MATTPVYTSDWIVIDYLIKVTEYSKLRKDVTKSAAEWTREIGVFASYLMVYMCVMIGLRAKW